MTRNSLRRVPAAGHRLQNIARTGQADIGIDGQCGLPFADWAVQDKPIGLYRAADSTGSPESFTEFSGVNGIEMRSKRVARFRLGPGD